MDLPYVAAPDEDGARGMLRREVKEVNAQKEKERDAEVERLYRKVVDAQKLESLMARRAELERKDSALYKACKGEINAYTDQVVPQIKAKPRKEWDAAIEAAERHVAQISYKYELQEKPLVEETRKVAAVARSYLDRIEHGKGSEFAGLSEEEKKLLPKVGLLAWEKLGGGYFSTQLDITVPMMDGSFIMGNSIEDRVYEGVDTDALQEADEADAMDELGL